MKISKCVGMCEWSTCDYAAWQWSSGLPLCNSEWNSPEGRPVTDSHFILPVRVRKPLPCHNPSPHNFSASWVSAVAIETTAEGRNSSPTPKVIHKTQLKLKLKLFMSKFVVEKIQKNCKDGSLKGRQFILKETDNWNTLYFMLEMPMCFRKVIQFPPPPLLTRTCIQENVLGTY